MRMNTEHQIPRLPRKRVEAKQCNRDKTCPNLGFPKELIGVLKK